MINLCNLRVSSAKAACVSLDVTLILACYNEETIFKNSLLQILEILDDAPWTYEIIIIDDSSSDSTKSLIKEFDSEEQHRHIRCYYNDSNIGRGGTISRGLRLAKGQIVGFIDIDLETHARYIPDCVQALQDGFDVATVHRIQKFEWRSSIRIFLSRGYSFLVRHSLGVPFSDTEAGFKFFVRDRIKGVLEKTKNKGWFWDTEVMVRSYMYGLNIVEIRCPYKRRFDKKSSVRLFKDSIIYLMDLIEFRKEIGRLRENSPVVVKCSRKGAY